MHERSAEDARSCARIGDDEGQGSGLYLERTLIIAVLQLLVGSSDQQHMSTLLLQESETHRQSLKRERH